MFDNTIYKLKYIVVDIFSQDNDKDSGDGYNTNTKMNDYQKSTPIASGNSKQRNTSSITGNKRRVSHQEDQSKAMKEIPSPPRKRLKMNSDENDNNIE